MAEPKIGIGLPTMGEIEILGTIGGIGAAARHVEELGFESVWAPDLIIGDGTPSLESTIALATTEFGQEVWISAVEGDIVNPYRILEGNPDDTGQIEPELGHHVGLFGAPPQLLAADRGCHSADNERLAGELGVRRVRVTRRGAKTEERRRHERRDWFRYAQKFRAGSEGRISVLKRRGHLGRCSEHGEEGFGRWVGWGVLTANLHTVSRRLAGG